MVRTQGQLTPRVAWHLGVTVGNALVSPRPHTHAHALHARLLIKPTAFTPYARGAKCRPHNHLRGLVLPDTRLFASLRVIRVCLW